MDIFAIPVRVYVEDTDAGGIVYHANYLKFMERTRTEFLRSLGYDKAGANRESFQFVVYSCSLAFKRPARLDDQLQVTAQLVQMGAATFVFNQQVLRDDELICDAEVKVACVSGKTLKPMAIPTEIRENLSARLAVG